MESKNILDLKVGDVLGKTISFHYDSSASFSGGPVEDVFKIQLTNNTSVTYYLRLTHTAVSQPTLTFYFEDELNNIIYSEEIGSEPTDIQIGGSKKYRIIGISNLDTTFLGTHTMTLNIEKALQSILYKIVSKIDTLSYKTDRILSRFTKSYDVLSSSAVPSGFTKNEAAATVIGGSIYQRIRTTKSSNWGTGNITNTQTASMVIKKTNYNTDYPEETMGGADWGYNIQGITGNSGGLKSYYTANSGTTRTYNIAAVETADTSVKITQISATCYDQV